MLAMLIGSRRLRLRAAATCVVLATASVSFGQEPGGADRSTTLVVTQGPRGGEWKRSFNPFRDDSDMRWPATAGVYEPLLVYSRATRTYQPWLATAYQWGAGNLTLRFTIRPAVTWSDGQPFTGRDVAFTFDLMRRFPVLDRQGVWGYLADVKSADGTSVEFTFKRAYTPGLLAIGTQPIVAEHKWKDVAQPLAFDDPNPVGTGPFVEVRRFSPDAYELGRNPKYWQKDKPSISAVRVPLFRNNEEIQRALDEDRLDWASLFVEDIEKRWVAKDPVRHLYWYPDFGPTVLMLVNTKKKPFDDAAVRKAISLALDRPRIMREAMQGYAPPADATGLAASQSQWKDPAALRGGDWTRHDVAQANSLLDTAGLARGEGGTRSVPGPGGGPMRYDLNIVEGWSDWGVAAGIIRQNLAEVGVEVSVKALPYDAMVGALERGRFDLGMWFGERGPTPYEFYRSQMDSAFAKPIGEKAVSNFHRFANEEASRALRRFEASSDPAELERLGKELQKIYVDGAPSLPLFASPLWGVYNASRLTGFPSRFSPYAGSSPGAHSDNLQVLVGVKPR
jgi:peptide/nickel transport system substrate-binding protein